MSSRDDDDDDDDGDDGDDGVRAAEKNVKILTQSRNNNVYKNCENDKMISFRTYVYYRYIFLSMQEMRVCKIKNSRDVFLSHVSITKHR